MLLTASPPSDFPVYMCPVYTRLAGDVLSNLSYVQSNAKLTPGQKTTLGPVHHFLLKEMMPERGEHPPLQKAP